MQRLPDPHGMIARVRSKFPPNCSIRLSKFCDHIIAMRLQGVPYQKIAEWLEEQGKEHRIPIATLWRNFKQTKMRIELPYAEEIAERWGGTIDLDVGRELAGQVMLQRMRVDKLVKAEARKQETSPTYLDKRIRFEMEVMNDMMRNLHGMMKDPVDAANERAKADAIKGGTQPIAMSQDAEKLMEDMILSGDIKFKEDPDAASTVQ